METTIRADGETTTLINVFTVEPKNQYELVRILKECTEVLISKSEGWISTSFLNSKDGQRVILHSQWQTANDIESFRQNPRMVPFVQRGAALAKHEAIECEVDGEDVLQQALLNALEASGRIESPTNPEAWLFRIAHNAALDFLRRRARQEIAHPHEDLDVIASPVDPIRDREIAAASLRTFLRLPVAQRSTIILKDVLGYSLQEVCEVTGGSIPSAKSAL
jgi:RNA polymerase sigma factor (sigma-70 family)